MRLEERLDKIELIYKMAEDDEEYKELLLPKEENVCGEGKKFN